MGVAKCDAPNDANLIDWIVCVCYMGVLSHTSGIY